MDEFYTDKCINLRIITRNIISLLKFNLISNVGGRMGDGSIFQLFHYIKSKPTVKIQNTTIKTLF